MHGDAAEDVFGPGLGVLHLDVEVAAVVEDTRIDQLVLEFVPGPGPVRRHQVVVGELGLRVLVELALVAVRRQVIDVEVVLLDVLAVVALGIGQAEQALLQDRVPLVPQRQSQAQPLLVVADPGEAVLPPAVRARPGLIMTEVRPGVAVVAVVLPDRAPLALAEIRSPGPPRNARPGPPAAAAPRRSARPDRPGPVVTQARLAWSRSSSTASRWQPHGGKSTNSPWSASSSPFRSKTRSSSRSVSSPAAAAQVGPSPARPAPGRAQRRNSPPPGAARHRTRTRRGDCGRNRCRASRRTRAAASRPTAPGGWPRGQQPPVPVGQAGVGRLVRAARQEDRRAYTPALELPFVPQGGARAGWQWPPPRPARRRRGSRSAMRGSSWFSRKRTSRDW